MNWIVINYKLEKVRYFGEETKIWEEQNKDKSVIRGVRKSEMYKLRCGSESGDWRKERKTQSKNIYEKGTPRVRQSIKFTLNKWLLNTRLPYRYKDTDKQIIRKLWIIKVLTWGVSEE